MTGGALRVAVLQGGPSSEAAVSRVSAAAVASALREAGYEVTLLELDAALGRVLDRGRFDVVFPVLHGPLGEDGCVQGLLEVLGMPYVGSGVLASALAASKPHAKAQFRRVGLPVADERLVRRGDELAARAREVRDALGPRVVVKPASGGSGIGVARITDDAPLAAWVAAFERALEHDSVLLVETFVRGLEVTCGVLEDDDGRARALPPTLISAKAADWYDFKSRYGTGGSVHQCPAPFTPELTARIRAVAVGAHEALGARDLSRVDFVVSESDPASAVTLLEVNTLPGMTATSLFPEAAGVAGVGFVELCRRLVERAHSRPERPAPPVVPMPA